MSSTKSAEAGRLRRWLPVLGWAALISTFSTQWFSNEQTGHVLLPLLHWMLPGLHPSTLHTVHEGVRKSGHMSEFFVFSLLLDRTLRAEGWTPRAAACGAALFAIVFAALDEIHQLFVPGRTAAVSDVGVDALGAIAAQLLLVVRRQLGLPTPAGSPPPDPVGVH